MDLVWIHRGLLQRPVVHSAYVAGAVVRLTLKERWYQTHLMVPLVESIRDDRFQGSQFFTGHGECP